MLNTHIPISSPDRILLRPGTAQILRHERSATLRYCPHDSYITRLKYCLNVDEAREYCKERDIRVLA